MEKPYSNSSYNSTQGSISSGSRKGKHATTNKPAKLTPEHILSYELNNIKRLQGSRRKNVTTEDVDHILDTNARLIEQLADPSMTRNSYEYMEKFAELQRNLVLVSRLADQPR